ncbi:MAG: hypothetical protein E6Q71_00425 [Pseudomonas sp.]|nr:MAG: hypothetical protein E6Q71_00425 [Pseudomonas sp.]
MKRKQSITSIRWDLQLRYRLLETVVWIVIRFRLQSTNLCPLRTRLPALTFIQSLLCKNN